MEQKISELIRIAGLFGVNAAQANENSVKRKEIAEKIIMYLSPLEQMNDKFMTVSANFSQVVSQVTDQAKSAKEVLARDNQIENGQLILSVTQEIEAGMAQLESDQGNIRKKKESQKRSLLQLQSIAYDMLEDIQTAIDASALNKERGKKLGELFGQIPEKIKSQAGDWLNNVLGEIATGREFSARVHNKSKTQLEFTNNFTGFIKRMHEGSNEVQNIWQKALATLDQAAKSIQKIPGTVLSKPEFSFFQGDYIVSQKKAIEDSVLLLSRQESEYFEKSSKAAEEMLAVTKIPLEKSSLNMENGRVMEELFREIRGTVR